MVKTMECIVCGMPNKYEMYTEQSFGIVEQHYYCKRCGYFIEQAYSGVYEGISSDFPEEYSSKVDILGLNVVNPEEVP